MIRWGGVNYWSHLTFLEHIGLKFPQKNINAYLLKANFGRKEKAKSEIDNQGLISHGGRVLIWSRIGKNLLRLRPKLCALLWSDNEIGKQTNIERKRQESSFAPGLAKSCWDWDPYCVHYLDQIKSYNRANKLKLGGKSESSFDQGSAKTFEAQNVCITLIR